MSIKLFISCSHLDENYINKFRKHTTPLKQNGLIIEWYDRKIIAGDDLNKKINENIDAADIICLFISVDFLASNACVEETEKAFVLKETHGVSVAPIILSDCAGQV